MILTDNTTNTEFLFVFVKDFKWSNPLEHEQVGGHPMPGRLYRAIKNTDTGTYRLLTKPNTLLVFSGLEEDIDTGYRSSFKPITVQTLLDYNITDEDLDKLLDWLRTGNKEIKDLVGMMSPPAPVKLTTPSSLSPQFKESIMQKSNEEVSDFISCAHLLHELNPNLLDAIHDYLHYAIEQEQKSEEGPLNSTFLTLSKEHGTGANVIQAVQKLSRYVSVNKRISLDENDLFGAITNLFNEQTNRIVNK